uniref:Uncharacterized protein n=1 Tax=Zooxanthella nutricula TaxID=1333877 RepID=A0A7S2QER8_9DINO
MALPASGVQDDLEGSMTESNASSATMPAPKEGALVELPRRGAYLPRRVVQLVPREKEEPDSSFTAHFTALSHLLTGRFLTLNKREEPSGLKDSVLNEMQNLGVIAALLTTLFFPLLYENTSDILEEKYAGSGLDIHGSRIGAMLGHDAVDAMLNFLADLDVLYYGIACVSFGFATICCLCLMLVIGKMDDDEQVKRFLARMGWKMRVPFLCCMAGWAGSFGIGLRMACVIKQWWTLLVGSVAVGCIGLGSSWCTMLCGVMCVMDVLDEAGAIRPLCLSAEEVCSDVASYVAEAGDESSLSGCTFALSAVGPCGETVPLSNVTRLRVSVEFRRQMGKLVGATAEELALALAAM